MPRAPKPAHARQRTNTRSVGTLSVVAAAEPPPAPKPPRGALLKVTSEAWDAFWSSPVSQLVEPGSDLPALRRLFLLYDDRERVLRRVAQAGRLTNGSTGQLVLDPLYKHLGTIDGQITALEDRFGLTPLARLKLGATFGAAAQSLDAANQALEADDDGDDDQGEELDPRLAVIDTTAG